MTRTAVVTGASRGLGHMLAGFLAAQDYSLVLTARDQGALEKSARTLTGSGRVRTVAGDVRDPAHRQEIIEAARALGGNQQGGLGLLVNNASTLGPTPLPPLTDLPLESFREVLEVNLLAPLALVQEALPLLEAGRGLIVNVSSDAALGGYEGWGGYGSSKAALDLVSKKLAAELGERGVSAVSVDPGDLRTAMHQAAFPGEDISDRPLPEVTLPFWAWLLGQDPRSVSGGRYRAQGECWTLVNA